MREEHSVLHWTETLGCSKDELATAVAKVGNSPNAVRRAVFRAWAYGTFQLGAPKTEGAISAATSIGTARQVSVKAPVRSRRGICLASLPCDVILGVMASNHDLNPQKHGI